jgi:hypothetical protein
MPNPTTRPSSHAIQRAGLYLVAAEALLRGHKVEIQKQGRLGWVLVDGRRVEVHIAKDEWPLTGALVQPEADVVVFVRRSTENSAHEYFIATREDALGALAADMMEFLARHDGIRPRTPGSDQQTLHAHLAEPWKDRWDVLRG